MRSTLQRLDNRTWRGIVTLIGLTVLAACGSAYGTSSMSPNGSNTPPPTGPTNVTVANNTFSPANLTVASGSTVTWTWNSCSGGDAYGTGQICVSHNIVFDDGTTSGTMDQGSFQRGFTAAGTYPYHCSIHGLSMSGKITVQ